MRVRLLPAADRELEDAAEWYAANASRTVSTNFIAAYDTIANLISDNPGIGTPSAAGTRTLRFRGFRTPQSIAFIPTTRSSLLSHISTAGPDTGRSGIDFRLRRAAL